MKLSSIRFIHTIPIIFGFLVASSVQTAEIITEEDLRQEIITEEHLVKTADNAIFLFDSSGSMKRPYKNTGKSMYELLVAEMKKRNSYFPNLGHNLGLYLHTPWKEIYPMQRYDRKKFAKALDSLPEKPKGPTLLLYGLGRLDGVLKGVSGKTAVFVFTDGTYSVEQAQEATTTKQSVTGKTPRLVAQHLAAKHNVCFYIISTADSQRNREILKSVAMVNSCSRVIPFWAYLERPEYNSGALFVVKATEKVITIADQKIVGLKTDNVQFSFDSSQTERRDFPEMDEVGTFLNEHPDAYIMLDGYADSVGPAEYNMQLSRRRAEAVGHYLETKHNVARERIVLRWHGPTNPTASNDAEEGRAKNRRVEMAIGGLS